MPGLVPGIHAFLPIKQDVDGRDKPGHDVERTMINLNDHTRCILMSTGGPLAMV
jgi:hypothetical protein